MEPHKIPCNTTSLLACAFSVPHAEICVFFVSGGDLQLGKERFSEWQERLSVAKVSSLSFDHSGVQGSGTILEESSLAGRIEEAACAAEWMRTAMPAKEYGLYGVSMGGAIALGLVASMPDVFSKLILHAPAAYSAHAQRLAFGRAFTEEIRREGGWNDSPSFDQLRACSLPTLFIEAEHDEVIPTAVTKRYQAMRAGDPAFQSMLLPDALHGVWQDTPDCARHRAAIADAIAAFILPPNAARP
jgi:uncharacterized protein